MSSQSSMSGAPVLNAAYVHGNFEPSGLLYEPAWSTAEPVHIVRDATNGEDVPSLRVTARALWNEEYLYLAYDAAYTELTAFDQGPGQRRMGLWEKDVLEAFIGLDGDEIPKAYAEFEWAPNGDWLSVGVDFANDKKYFEYDSGHMFKCNVDEANKQWRVEARIPLPLNLGFAAGPTPKAGDRWRVNLFRFDTAQDAYLAWNPTMKNPAAFHVPEKFGTLHFS